MWGAERGSEEHSVSGQKVLKGTTMCPHFNMAMAVGTAVTSTCINKYFLHKVTVPKYLTLC